MKIDMKKVIIAVTMCAGFMISQSSHAKVRSAQSQRDFEQRIAQKGMCVVLFYHGDKENKKLREKNKRLKSMFEDLSSEKSYDEADVVFMRVNLARDEFADFMEQYHVTTVPSFILFSDGHQLMDEQGQPRVLTGFVKRSALKEFIDKHCGAMIKKLNVARSEEKKEQIKEEKSSWLPYFYPRDMFVEGYSPAERDME